MPEPEWTAIADGVRYTWPEVVRKIGDGAWTLEQATAYTGLGYEALKMRVGVYGNLAKDWATRHAARRALQRFGAQAAAGTGARVAASRGLLALLRGIGLRLGLTGAAATGAGVVVATAAVAGLVYVGSQIAGEYAADRPSAQLGPTGTRRTCPPAKPHKTMCPWGPQAGYHVGECGPGWCYDGGGHGTGACKQTTAPPGSRRGYTNDVFCPDGTEGVIDPCTGVVLRCNPR